MKKLLLLILTVFLCTITSINAFADTHQTNVTIAEGDNSFEENFDIINANFTNDGIFRIVLFSASNATCLNNVNLTVKDGFTMVNNSKFTNKGIITINSASLIIDDGTTFTNSGTVYLKNIESCDLSGTITVSDDGCFVYDKTVAQSVVDRLKEICFDKVIQSDDIKVDQNGTTSAGNENVEGNGAGENGELGGSADVKADYQAGTPEKAVYNVDITWGSLEFTYTDSSKGTWNPTTHKYDGAEGAEWTWETGANEITVTNHSNTAVTATATYTPKSGYESVSLIFDKGTVNLGTADNGAVGGAGTPTSDTITVTPSGTLKESKTRAVIGTITITIS